jgi:hypothetical protein
MYRIVRVARRPGLHDLHPFDHVYGFRAPSIVRPKYA